MCILAAVSAFVLQISHLSYQLSEETCLDVLGVRFTPDADSTVALNFALSRGRRHWLQRRRQLCRRRVSLRKRLERYYATVVATVLHGLEGLPLSQNLLNQVLSLDRRNLKSMLCLRKRADETWVKLYQRQNSFLRAFTAKTGILELGARLLSKQHAWAGH